MTEKLPSDGERLELGKLRRHIRILVDLGRLAGQYSDIDRFLDQAVVQVARAVEIDHFKILRYRRKTADLLMAAGLGWKEGIVRGWRRSRQICDRPLGVLTKQRNRSPSPTQQVHPASSLRY